MIDLEVRPADPMIIRIMKSRLGKGERIYRKLRKGSDTTENGYLTKIFYDGDNDGTYVLFNTGSSQKFNYVTIKDDDEDWNLLPGFRKGTWQLKRIPASEREGTPATEKSDIKENTESTGHTLSDMINVLVNKGEEVQMSIDSGAGDQGALVDGAAYDAQHDVVTVENSIQGRSGDWTAGPDFEIANPDSWDLVKRDNYWWLYEAE